MVDHRARYARIHIGSRQGTVAGGACLPAWRVIRTYAQTIIVGKNTVSGVVASE